MGGPVPRFRPKQRRPNHDSHDRMGKVPATDAYQARLHAQFRPAQQRRRQTYEQMQSGTLAAAYMTRPTAMAYPVVAVTGTHVYGHWPGW